MVASAVGRCYSLPENPDKLRVHVVGHYPAVSSADVATREGLQRGGGSHPFTYTEDPRYNYTICYQRFCC